MANLRLIVIKYDCIYQYSRQYHNYFKSLWSWMQLFYLTGYSFIINVERSELSSSDNW